MCIDLIVWMDLVLDTECCDELCESGKLYVGWLAYLEVAQ